MLLFSEEGEKIGTALFDGSIPVSVDISGPVIAAVFNRTVLGGDKILRVWDREGNPLAQAAFSGEITQIRATEKGVLALTSSSLLFLDPVTGQTDSIPVDPGSLALLPTGPDAALVCYPGRASVLSFDPAETEETHAADS